MRCAANRSSTRHRESVEGKGVKAGERGQREKGIELGLELCALACACDTQVPHFHGSQAVPPPLSPLCQENGGMSGDHILSLSNINTFCCSADTCGSGPVRSVPRATPAPFASSASVVTWPAPPHSPLLSPLYPVPVTVTVTVAAPCPVHPPLSHLDMSMSMFMSWA